MVTGQTFQRTRRKGMAKGCSDVHKKNHLTEDYRFFAALLLDMDSGNAAAREA